MRKTFLTILLITFSVLTVLSQNITGTWNGTLDFGMKKLRIVFHIEKQNGGYISTLDSPDQSKFGMPATTTTLTKKILKINILQLMATFEGKVKKNSIEGTFTQMGQTFNLVLTRGNVEIKRPQTPKPPFPYKSEDVYFENKEDGIILAGTFTYPRLGNNFPAVILITGSGAQNRDEEILNHRPFAVIADFLTQNGIAVFRYDDRGTGASTGTYYDADIQDFTTDALSALSYVKNRHEVNNQKIGLIGHSEGASIAFMIAAQNNDLAYIISMAGVAIKGDSLMKHQRFLISKAMDISDKEIEETEELVKIIHATIDKHTADSVFNFADKFVDEIIPTKSQKNSSVRETYKKHLQMLASPEIQSFILYDPTEDLQKINCSVLAINGDKDLQVPADINLPIIEKLLKNKVTIKKYPNLNHLFQHTETGLLSEYGTIEETISPEVLKDIYNWIINLK